MSKAKKQLSHLEWLHKKQENSAGSKQTKLKRSNTENVDDIPNEQNISPSRFMNRHNNKLNEKAQSLSKLESKIKQEQQKVKQGREISNKTSNDWRHGPKSMKEIHLKEVIKFKNTGINRSKQGVQITKLQSQVNLAKKQSQTFSDLEQNVQRFQRNSKLLEKIPDHRRIRSSSKISEKILEIKHFFKDDDNDESQKSQNKSNQDEDQRSEEHNKQRQQKLEELQHLLQLKLKTEPDQSTPFDLKSFRQTGFSKVTQMSTTSRYSIGLNIQKSKLSDILSKKQLNNSKSLIKQNEEQRQSKNLSPHPKQWQFHNCLSLQKIQLYRTNLRISCEGWTAIDYLELKYLRGWNPKVEDDFSPIIRLFIAKVCLGLGDYYGFKYDVDRIFVRVNDKHIYFDQREKLQEKGERIKGIAPHTILSLRQLITATTLTTHQDLVTHSVLTLGYIIKKFHNSKYPSPRTHPTQSSQNRIDPLAQIRSQDGYLVFIKQTQASVLQDYCENFQQQCARLCRSLQMSNTRVMVGFNCLYRNFWGRTHKNKISKGLYQVNQYMVVSSSLDAAILFMKCMADHTFKKMFQFRVYEAEVKFQVGWNFWETRTLRWPNSEYLKYRLKGVGGKTNKGNQCYVVWDEQRNLIISMADCKVNMHWKDTERIQEWVEKHIPRFSKNYCLNMTFYPSDTQKFMKIN